MAFVPTKKDPKTRLYQIRMTEALYQELERAAKQTKVQKQELVRQLIEFGLKEIQKPKKESV